MEGDEEVEEVEDEVEEGGTSLVVRNLAKSARYLILSSLFVFQVFLMLSGRKDDAVVVVDVVFVFAVVGVVVVVVVVGLVVVDITGL